ncbi:MAG: hypothetical protein Q9210_004730, partial [Variospora velana]
MASGALTEQGPQIELTPGGGNPTQDPFSSISIASDLASSRDGKLKQRLPPEGTKAPPISNLQGAAVLHKANIPIFGTAGRLTTNSRNQPSKLIRNVSKDPLSQTSSDSRKESQAGIDPLSQHIFKRTHTSNMLPSQQQRPRPGVPTDDSGIPEPAASARTSSEPAVARADTASFGTKDKKKGPKFLSRLIGSKKKELPVDINDDDSEMGDKRTEGTDADVFSQPVESNGFIPRFPSPPKYIKVRSHGKKKKDFNRIFLAQQLRGRTGVEIAQAGGRLVKSEGYKKGDPKKDGNAIWAMGFSVDGKYLAAGGQDNLVRVWAVISSAEERRAHEAEEEAAGKEGEHVRLNAPVFRSKPVQEYEGHTASVLDLSWSKNNFLLSSSMDKTVRLWHASRTECLCCFKHSDFVTSIQFHPRDDRFFLAGSLDSKLRLWSIPDKSVAYWNQVPDLITAVAFAPDGKTAIAGCLNGLCLFYETEGLKYQTQIHVRSAHGKNAKGSKVTGIQAITFPPDNQNAEVKVLVTSNDSRVRVYNLRDKGLEMKLKGNENSCSQIRACFSEDAKYIICGSEDRKAYIWPTAHLETDKEKRPVEMFEAHPAIVTTAVMAPARTRQLLSASGDPLYDLCNPPPVTLISRSESHSSRAPTENGNTETPFPPTPAISTSDFDKSSKPEESPAYIARSAHPGGNIIVTADYMGHIKIFRQDCAYQKRLRNDVNFSKKMLGRANSVATRHSNRSYRDSLASTSQHPSSDRILSWRQSVNNPSLDNFRHPTNRSTSPSKSHHHTFSTPRHNSSPNHITLASSPVPNTPNTATTAATAATSPPQPSSSTNQHRPSSPAGANNNGLNIKNIAPSNIADTNPLMLQGDQSYMFWNKSAYRAQAAAALSNTHSYAQNPLHRRHRSNGTSVDDTTASSRNSGEVAIGGAGGLLDAPSAAAAARQMSA